jgi:hypothetical protein
MGSKLRFCLKLQIPGDTVLATMKAFRPKARQVAWRFMCCVAVLHLYCLDRTWAQAPTAQTLGSLRATGEVYLNGVRATGEQTIFPGDKVQTGPDGAAALTSPGFGLLIIPAQSEISFRAAPYLATLKQGSVEVRSFPPSKNLGIQFGNTVMYLPSSESGSTEAITLRADGSARVACGLGAVSLRSIDGVELGALHSNQAVEIGADGKLQKVESIVLIPDTQTSSGAAAPSGPAAAGKSSHTGYVVLAVIAGGGGAAAAIGP